MNPEEHRDYCPRCGVAYEPLQEYCLECGERLPTNRGVVGVLASSWQRRFAWYPGDWIWPVAFFFLLTIVATAAVLTVNATRSSAQSTATAVPSGVTVGPGSTTSGGAPVSTSTTPAVPSPTITTGPLPTAPGTGTSPTGTTPTPPQPNPNALASWPADKSGYTNVHESLPVGNGRAIAVQHARAAKRAGLKDVGVLVSSQYSSLHPDYFVVFQGIYATQAEAQAGLAAVHAKGYRGAYQTRVTR
jgi:hypothetical protein